jgi:hypothetical protein
MKKHSRTLITAALILTLTGGVFLWMGPKNAGACGTGRAGGQDYTPQRRDSSGETSRRQALSLEQARNIVAYHVERLNPNLGIGTINDAGGFYEAEILSKSSEVLQLLGVDKFSGRVMLIN